MGRKNLKNKLFGLFILIGVIPLISVLVFSSYLKINELEDAARDEMWTKTIAVDSHVEDRLNTNFYMLHAAAFMPSIKDFFVNSTPESTQLVSDTLREINGIFRDDSLMALTGPDGMQLLRTDNLAPVNIFKREHFQTAIKGHDYVSNVIKSMASGGNIVVISSPVRNGKGEVTGTIQRNLLISEFQKFVESMSDENTSILLLDRDGNVVARSNKNLYGEENGELNIPTLFVSKAMAGIFGVTRMELSGTDCIVSYRKNAITGWPIIIIKPYSYILSRVHEAIMRTAGIGIVFIILVSVAAYRFSGKTVKPIHDFLSNARRAANEGNVVKEVDIATNDEVEEIAEAFNMIRSARDSYRQETERDTLTSLYTRGAVEAICRRKIEEYSEAGQEFGYIAFFLIDLDDFKNINKMYGRIFGDRVLFEFAQRLRKLYRPLDCVGRMEADEFIAVVDQVSDIAEVMQKAKHLNNMAKNLIVDDQNIELAATIGISFYPKNGATYDEVIRAARHALSKAKTKGKGSYYVED